MVTPSLTTVDYVIAVSIVLVPVFIGIWFSIKDANKATRHEYLLGGGNMSMLPVAMSIFVTFQSAIAIIGIPAEVYFYSVGHFYLSLGLSLSYVVGYFTLVPLMYPLRLTSVYEYLQLRYKSKSVRYLSTALGMLTTVLYMAVALLSPALALETTVGVPLWVSIAMTGAIGTLYTAMGGIKSVVWTDAYQTIIITFGLSAIIIKACVDVGGINEVWRIAEEGGRINLNRFTLDPRSRHEMWGLVIGGCFMWLVNGFNQSTIQRISSMGSLRKANLAFLLNIPFNLLFMNTLVAVGLCIYSYYSFLGCGPFENAAIMNKNQLAPYYVVHGMADLPGMSGVFVAILCCGALSTLSSGINALAANTVEDVLQYPLRGLKEATITFITKIIVLGYGVLIIGLTYAAQSLQGPVTQMALTAFGACGSPVVGVFLMGASVPWANKYGAISSIIWTTAFNLWVSVCNRLYGPEISGLEPVGTTQCYQSENLTTTLTGLNTTHQTTFSRSFETDIFRTIPTAAAVSLSSMDEENKFKFFLYDISYEWYGLMGIVVSLVVGLTVSFLTRGKQKDSSFDSKLIFPFLRKFWKLPEPLENDVNLMNCEVTVKAPIEKIVLPTELSDNGSPKEDFIRDIM